MAAAPRRMRKTWRIGGSAISAAVLVRASTESDWRIGSIGSAHNWSLGGGGGWGASHGDGGAEGCSPIIGSSYKSPLTEECFCTKLRSCSESGTLLLKCRHQNNVSQVFYYLSTKSQSQTEPIADHERHRFKGQGPVSKKVRKHTAWFLVPDVGGR